MMRATNWEVRHSMLLHQLIIAGAFLVYLIQRDDIVWHFIKAHTSDRQLWERSLFAIATLQVGAGAAIFTWTARRPVSGVRRRSVSGLGELVYAIGLGYLAPLWGFVILVALETVRVTRLIRRKDRAESQHVSAGGTQDVSSPVWEAFRRQSFKWGMFLTMIVFTITLEDRLAEILAVAACGAGFLLMLPFAKSSAKIAAI